MKSGEMEKMKLKRNTGTGSKGALPLFSPKGNHPNLS